MVESSGSILLPEQEPGIILDGCGRDVLTAARWLAAVWRGGPGRAEARPGQSKEASAVNNGADHEARAGDLDAECGPLDWRSERLEAMTDTDDREYREELARLRQEHRDLDAAIAALQ